MGYYADVDGYIGFRRELQPEEIEKLDSMLDEAWETYDHSQQSGVITSVSFWSGDKYYSDTEELLNEIAAAFPVKEGCVDCHGEDGEHWRFKYSGGHNGGKFLYICGRVVYDDEMPVELNDRMEFIGQIIDVFEDFLDEKGIVIPNDDKEQSGDGAANIYGDDYDRLQAGIEDTLIAWHILKPQSEIPE